MFHGLTRQVLASCLDYSTRCSALVNQHIHRTDTSAILACTDWGSSQWSTKQYHSS